MELCGPVICYRYINRGMQVATVLSQELALLVMIGLLSYFEPLQYVVAPLSHSASESSNWLSALAPVGREGAVALIKEASVRWVNLQHELIPPCWGWKRSLLGQFL